MLKHPNRLWLATLLLGWIFDLLFWDCIPMGISFSIYVLLCLLGGFLVLNLESLKPSWKALLLLLPILFLAAMTFVRQEPLTVFLAVILTLFCMALLAMTYLGGRWMNYSMADHAVGFIRLIGGVLSRPFGLLAETRRQQTESKQRSGWHRVWSVLRGMLIAVPILAIFAALLSSADLVFARRLDVFVSFFNLERMSEYITRGVCILVMMYLLAGTFLHAASRSRDEKLIGEQKPVVPSFLGFTESSIVLGGVVLLFSAFVIIQFRYFFGGEANIAAEGFTYSEYARRGFGELVAVAFISLLFFLGLSGIARRESPAQRWAFSALGITLVVLVGVMLVSAFQRLLLYEAAYGFTRLRTYTHVFIIWLALLLAAVVVLEVLRHQRHFALAAVLAALGFAVSLSLLNVDAFIANQNIARAEQGEDLDVGYLASLSSDSVPRLVSLYRATDTPFEVRDAIGAALACRNVTTGESPEDWRTYTISEQLSEKALQAVREDIEDYRELDDPLPQVLSPSGETYTCMSGYGD